jgi:hypothetical protein
MESTLEGETDRKIMVLEDATDGIRNMVAQLDGETDAVTIEMDDATGGLRNIFSEDWSGETSSEMLLEGIGGLSISLDGQTDIIDATVVGATDLSAAWDGETEAVNVDITGAGIIFFIDINGETAANKIDIFADVEAQSILEGQTVMTATIEDATSGDRFITAAWDGQTDAITISTDDSKGFMDASWDGETSEIAINGCLRSFWYLGDECVGTLQNGDLKVIKAYLGDEEVWCLCSSC